MTIFSFELSTIYMHKLSNCMLKWLLL